MSGRYIQRSVYDAAATQEVNCTLWHDDEIGGTKYRAGMSLQQSGGSTSCSIVGVGVGVSVSEFVK